MEVFVIEQLKLENQLCFPLYAAAKEVVKQYTPFLSEIGLTYTQYVTMMVIWEKKEISVKELGNALFLDSGTLTPLLKKLEASGFITRSRSEADERSVIIRITEAGNELKYRAQEIPLKMGQCLNLSQDEISVLYGLLYKILNQFTSSRN